MLCCSPPVGRPLDGPQGEGWLAASKLCCGGVYRPEVSGILLFEMLVVLIGF
jgi:hypothetical protein